MMNDSSVSSRSDDAIPLFLSFCIEQYKNACGLSGGEAMQELCQSGALDYLEKNYEVIHTQSPEWILEEIVEYQNTHGKQ